MAELSSSKIYHLAKRIFGCSGLAKRRSRGPVRPASRCVRLFDPVPGATAEQIDSVWLARPELRSPEEAADYLELSGFKGEAGTLAAVFVDNRCGLISSELIVAVAPAERADMVRRILGRAATCHAHGLILATNDPTGEIACTAAWHELTNCLASKAEATGVALLNHLVLTAEGWKTMALEPFAGGAWMACGRSPAVSR